MILIYILDGKKMLQKVPQTTNYVPNIFVVGFIISMTISNSHAEGGLLLEMISPGRSQSLHHR